MAKTRVSINIDMNNFIKIRELANKSFQKNFSKAINWVLYSTMKPSNFYRFMAQHHAGQLQHFKEILDHYETSSVEETGKVYETIEI